MATVGSSGDVIADQMGALEEAYAGFPVNQVTLSVSREAYERARERCSEGFVDVYVEVYNESGQALLVERDGEPVVPHARPCRDERLETGVRRRIRERTGVECRVTDVQRATILGVRDETTPDPDPVYRLVAVFVAERTGGSPSGDAVWRSGIPESALPNH